MADKGGIVDLLAGFKAAPITRRGKVIGQKATVEIKEQSLLDLRPETWTGAVAAELTRLVPENMKAGLKPNGQPLPPLSASTVERRKYRAGQAARGGYPKTGGRVRNWKDVSKTVKNYHRRFTPKSAAFRAKGPFTPLGGMLAGLESGLMAASWVVVREADRFVGYFADARSVIDKWGTSAVQRCIRKGILDFTNIGNHQRVKDTLTRTAKQAIANSRAALDKSHAVLMRAMLETAANVAELAGD